jgi:hypothetical protein
LENSGFFNSVNGDRKYKADFFAEYFASFIGNGVFPNPSTNLQVIANDDMTVTVKAGQGWINGYYYNNDDDLIVSIDNADGVLNRIDRIVLQYSTVNREIKAVVKKGTFASSPVAPTLQRDADAYELAIADISVGAGVTSISQSNIADLRLNTELCGIVIGTVEQVDTTTIFNQYTQGFADKEDEFEQEFTDWFATIQNALDGDTAGNLLNLINVNATNINTINTNVGNLSTLTTTDKTSLVNAVNENVTQLSNLSNMVIIKSNITILSTSWTDDTATSGFWIYDITDTDITANTVVDVNIALSSLENASDLKSANDSYAGYVRLYADSQPSADIACDLRLTRQVV